MSKLARIITWTLAPLFLILVLLILFLPTLVSTPSGQKTAVSLVNKVIPGSLKVDQWKLGWLSGQEITGFQLNDEKGGEILSFKSLKTDETLLSLLLRRYNVGKTTLVAPKLNLSTDESGNFNLHQALGQEKEDSERASRSDKSRFQGDIEVIDGTFSFKAPKVETIEITDVQMDLKSDPHVFHLVGKTKQGANVGEVKLSGTWQDKIEILADIKDFPVALFDQLQDTKLFTSAVGAHLNLNASLSTIDGGLSLKSHISSPNLNGDINGITKDCLFQVDPSSVLNFKVAPTFIEALLPEESKWKLANKPELTVKLQQVTFPCNQKSLTFDDIDFIAQIELTRTELSNEVLGNLSINQFWGRLQKDELFEVNYEAQLQGKGATTDMRGDFAFSEEGNIRYSTNASGLPIEFLTLFNDSATALIPIVGRQVDFASEGTINRKRINSDFTLGTVHGNVKGHLEGNVHGLMHLTAEGKIKPPMKIAKVIGPTPLFTCDAEISMKEKRFTVPKVTATLINEFIDIVATGRCGTEKLGCEPSTMDFRVKGHVTKLPVKAEGKEALEILGANFLLVVDGAKNSILGEGVVHASLPESGKSHSLEVSGSLKNYIHDEVIDFKKGDLVFKGQSKQFPVAFFDLFVDALPLTDLIGSNLDLRVDGSYSHAQENLLSLDFHALGKGFQTDFAVTMNDTFTLKEKKPATILWEMTPERYKTLLHLVHPDNESEFSLIEPVLLDFTVHELYCPTKIPDQVTEYICQSGLTGNLMVGPVHFVQNRTKQQFSLYDVTAEIRSQNFSELAHVESKGKFYSPKVPGKEHSGYTFSGDFLHLWTPLGKFNKEKMKVKGDLNLELVPVHEITGVIPMDDEMRAIVRALLGDLVNARIYGEVAELEGPLTIDIKSNNFKTLLPLQLQGHNITLRHDVDAEITLTEQINEVVLKDIAPILITGAWSEHPLKLHVDADQFSLHFRPFTFKGIHIGRAMLDLGRLKVRNGGEIQSIMQFIRAKEVDAQGYMEAWFTPIYFSLHDGVSTYQRFDALIGGNVHVALWGQIDLANDRVHMTLGLSPETLAQRFNLKGLSNENMFQVKMRGSTSKLDLDWSSAKTRIGLILTKTSGHIGFIVGNLLESIMGSLGEERTPPPTTYPFPWSQEYPEMSGSSSQSQPRQGGLQGLFNRLIP